MESTPSKRRKISSGVSALIYDHTNKTTSRHSSFMSPTKASLSRFNPSLLSQPRSSTEEAPDGQPIRSIGGGLSLTPRRRSQTPRGASSPSRGLENDQNQSLTIGASPPAEARELEDGAQNSVDEQLEHGLQANIPQRSSKPGELRNLVSDVVNFQQDGDPELPLTPTQLGLEPAPEPPRGMLSSSPSRRAARRKVANKKTSPLKPREPPPDSTGGKSSQVPLSSIDMNMEDSQPQSEEIPTDEETLEKQGIREELLEQLKGIQDDVTYMEAELDRVKDRLHPGAVSQEECDGLISILASDNPTHRPLTPPPKPIPLSTRLSQFLPFSRPMPPPPPPPPKPNISTEPPPSHHPIEVEDPLPHLRLFTPLTIACEDTIISSPEAKDRLLQQRDITLKSPNDLLIVKLNLIINLTYPTVESLSLTDISPWADHELGSWIREQLPTGDISTIGFAIGRYWEVASIRSRCWQSCEDEFRGLLDPSRSSKSTNNPSIEKFAISKRRVRGRKSPLPPVPNTGPTTPPASDSNPESDGEDDFTSPIFSRFSFQKFLSQPTLLFSNFSDGGDVSLLITWRIGFDWTGEVESYLSAVTSFPAPWVSTDERGSLGKVGEAFDMLVRERGVRRAVEGIVGVLFAS